jgi:hypothetical protein
MNLFPYVAVSVVTAFISLAIMQPAQQSKATPLKSAIMSEAISKTELHRLRNYANAVTIKRQLCAKPVLGQNSLFCQKT